MTIIPFPRGPERITAGNPPPDALGAGHSAAILFFTGVRFERHAEMPAIDEVAAARPAKARRVSARRPRKA